MEILDALMIAAVSGVAGVPAHVGAAAIPIETHTNTPTKANERYNMMRNDVRADQ